MYTKLYILQNKLAKENSRGFILLANLMGHINI